MIELGYALGIIMWIVIGIDIQNKIKKRKKQ
jgi:hypothetical protein